MYRGSNMIVHQIQNFPYLLYIKLHLKMPGNEQLQISSPPTERQKYAPQVVMSCHVTIYVTMYPLDVLNKSLSCKNAFIYCCH